MSWRDWGNQAIKSTELSVVGNPSSSALLAEIDSTQFGSTSWPASKEYLVSWVVGASSLASFRLEHCLSTGLGSTAIRDRTVIFSPVGQSGQYVMNYTIEPGDRLRVRVDSTFTGNAFAKITAEPMT